MTTNKLKCNLCGGTIVDFDADRIIAPPSGEWCSFECLRETCSTLRPLEGASMAYGLFRWMSRNRTHRHTIGVEMQVELILGCADLAYRHRGEPS